MSKPESTVQREIMCALSNLGCSVWRNNTGRAWQGKKLDISGSIIQLKNGRSFRCTRGILLQDYRPVKFGLCEGSSDLIGIKPLLITEKHIGETIAQFLAVEVKTDHKRATQKQRTFIDHINDAGGIAIIAREQSNLVF